MIKDFKRDDKIKCLLWCERHCCLCGKACGTDIEVAHIDPKKGNDIDNAIPLCYECHAKIGHYNREHPKGSKYTPQELKKRRDQIYEEYTRHLVPPIHFEITQNLPFSNKKRTFPDVGFNINHLGDRLPVKVFVRVELFLGGRFLSTPGGHYNNKESWNLNPRLGYQGHFKVPEKAVKSTKRLEAKVFITIIDQFERSHSLLPVSWVYDRNKNLWWANP